jgi:hypothetical protein
VPQPDILLDDGQKLVHWHCPVIKNAMAPLFLKIPHNVYHFLYPVLELNASLHMLLNHGTPPRFEPPMVAYWWQLYGRANPVLKCLLYGYGIGALRHQMDNRLRLGSTKLANRIRLAAMPQQSIAVRNLFSIANQQKKLPLFSALACHNWD